MSIVTPAVLPSSKKDLEEKLALFASFPSISRIQIDVVDGKFASPASWPYSDSTDSPRAAPTEFKLMMQEGEMLPHLDRLEYEIDLMCADPEQAAGAWLALGATRLIVHAESVPHLPRLFASMRRRYGDVVSLGLALNVASDLALIEPCLPEIRFVQFMGIARIGRQGQPFDRRVFEKVRVFHERHANIPIQVDGGVSANNARELIKLGVSSLVVGSALSRGDNPSATLAALEALKSPFGV